MKTTTMKSQINALLSTVFQPNSPAESAVECVDRLLSAFKQVGQSTHYNVPALGALMAGDGLFEN